MIIIDELAYINEGLWNETIRALLNMKNAGVVAITTPRGPDNFVSLLIAMTNDDGTPFFNVLHMTTICDSCNKLPTIAERLSCNHGWIPTYKSREKQTRNAKMACVTNSESITMQEDCGIIVPGLDGTIFDHDLLRIAFNYKDSHLKFNDPHFIPPRIYVTSDPNADGKSDSAVVSGYWAPPRSLNEGGGYDRWVVLGVDILHTFGSEQDAMVLAHIKHIRNLKKFAKVPIIYVPENMTGTFASRGEEIVRKLKSVITLHEGGPDKKPGVHIDDNAKAGYMNTFRVLLDNGQLMWDSQLFTLSGPYCVKLRALHGQKKTNLELIIHDLLNQMMRMKFDDRGKITGKVGPYQDDGVMALVMGPYWSKAVENRYSPVYKWLRDLIWVES